MNHTASTHPLLPLLETQQQDAVRMQQVMEQEFQALKSNDLTMFDQAMDAKNQQLRHLEQQEQQLMPMLEQIIGAPGNKIRLEAYIAQSGNTQLLASWQTLHDTLKACHEQNQVNQRILEASRVQIQQTLDLLRGINSTPDTYQDSGQKTRSGSLGQFIGIA